jgi:transposase
MPLRDVACLTHLGWDTVKDIVKSDLARRYAKVPLKHVRQIAIDENYLGKSGKYVTLVIDLESGRILWVGEGRGGDALKDFWPKLRAAKAKIEAVACDMSAAYWSAVQEHLPKAAVVFDRFHIVKLANEAIDEVRRGLQRTLDLLGKKAIKGKRYLLLRGKENLAVEQKSALEEALKWNEPLSKAYYLKEELRELWNQPSHHEASVYLQNWILRARFSGLTPFERLAITLLTHAKSILNYFLHRITSGKMEGINNKIGRLTRLAYGYRDTEFLHLKLYSLHESNFKFSGV